MRARNLVLMLLGNVIVSIGVAYLAINVLGPTDSGADQRQQVVITVPVVFTGTPAPTQTPWIVTATLQEGFVPLPEGILPGTPGRNATGSAGALNVTAGPTDPQTLLPPNCILHTIESGDTPFGLATEYGVDGFQIMQINNLNDETAALLQIGDTLIIPLDGCPLAELPTRTPEPQTVVEGSTPGTPGTPNLSATPTVTLAPTAANASMTIAGVQNPSDVTAEGVEIVNNGELVQLTNWTLSDSQGNTYTFPSGNLFTGGRATVYTRVGQNTPIAYYWGRTTAVWEEGDVVTLTDEEGNVQATYRVGGSITLPGG